MTGSKLILLADGQERAGMAACSLLREKGFEADLVLSVDEALAAIKEISPDLLERKLKRIALAAQNDLARWVAHNFKNILAASVGSLNLIDPANPGQDTETKLNLLAESRKAQDSALELLDKIDSLTRAVAPNLTEVEELEVGAVVDEAWAKAGRQVLAEMKVDQPERADRFEAELEKVGFFNSARRLDLVRLVREDLAALLEALLVNALESTDLSESPRILVLAEMAGEYLELTVRDNGRGMDEETLGQAMIPLFSTKGKVGVGLGLSLADSLAARYGGELSLKSSPGLGTTVKVTLKVA